MKERRFDVNHDWSRLERVLSM